MLKMHKIENLKTDEKHIKKTCKNNYTKENYISWRNKINKLGMTEANIHSYIKYYESRFKTLIKYCINFS